MRSQNAEVVNLRRVAEAALLLALFTALAFQYIRFEVFETEKNAILGILAMVIVGANLAEFIHLRRLPKFKSPLTYAVVAFLGVVTLSTLFSISFSYSLWGSPTRGHGWTVIAIYAVLFWQAARSGQRLKDALIPVLVMTWLPIIIWAWQLYLEAGIGARFRPASTAGNPNYLAGWMVMFIAIFGFMVVQRISAWRRPFKLAQVLQGVMYIAVLLVSLATFAILSSRGAFAGFGVALVTGAVMLLALYRKKIILIALVVLTVIGGIIYINISLSFQVGRDANFSGLERLFIIYDDSRSFLWEAATNIVRRQAEPFRDVTGSPDQWAFLRPALGYGLETLEQTQVRFGEAFEASQWGSRYVERFHNLFWDWLAEAGSLGLLTLIIIYQVAFYLAMRYFGFIRQDQVWYWLGTQLIFIPIGVVLTAIVFARTDWVALIPLGGAIGLLIGLWAWMIRYAFVPPLPEADDAAPPTAKANGSANANDAASAPKIFTAQNAVVMGLLCAIAAQWVDNQFGFMQIISQTLFFILLGFLASVTGEGDEVDAITYEAGESTAESSYWLAGTLIAGLFIIYSFGRAIESNFTQAGIGTREYPYFLLITFVFGLVMVLIHRRLESTGVQESDNYPAKGKKNRRKEKPKTQNPAALPILWSIGGILVLWALFYAYRVILVNAGSSSLDDALTQPTGPDAAGVRWAYMLLSMNGILLMLIGLGLLYWNIKGRLRLSFSGLGLLLLPIFFIGGSLFYAQNFAISTMRATANGFTGIDRVEPLVAADTIYEVASSSPQGAGDVKLQLGWVDSLITQTSYVDATRQLQLLRRIQEQTQEALDTSPFFVNSKTWEVFRPRYEIIQQRLQSIPESPPASTGQQPAPGQPPPGFVPGQQPTPPAPPFFAAPQGSQPIAPPGVNFPTAPPPGQ